MQGMRFKIVDREVSRKESTQPQVILDSGESLMSRRPPLEMACIYCNGGI